MPSKPARYSHNKKVTSLWPDSATMLERSRVLLLAQWEELLRLRHAVIKSADLNDIHDLRVASRRFRALLELFYPFLSKVPKAGLRKAVRKLTRVLGGVRNIDEAVIFFQARIKTDDSVGLALVRALTLLRPGEFKRIKAALNEFDHRALDRVVQEMSGGVNKALIIRRNSISLLAYFSDVSIRLYLPIHQLLTIATIPERRRSRHFLRIAIKKWRYFFEIIAQILDRDYVQTVELLKEYQSLLGRMNDLVEFKFLIRTLELPKGEREDAKTVLRSEEELLLDKFCQLVGEKSLQYLMIADRALTSA